MKEFIEKTMVKIYSTCPTDKYGQVSKHNLQEGIFGEKEEDVKNYINENPTIIKLFTYGGGYMQYKAYSIISQDLKRLCNEALRKNPNYIRNLNSF